MSAEPEESPIWGLVALSGWIAVALAVAVVAALIIAGGH